MEYHYYYRLYSLTVLPIGVALRQEVSHEEVDAGYAADTAAGTTADMAGLDGVVCNLGIGGVGQATAGAAGLVGVGGMACLAEQGQGDPS